MTSHYPKRYKEKIIWISFLSRETCFNPFRTNGIFHKATYNKVGMVYCINSGDKGYNFEKNIVFLSLKIILS